MIKKSYGWVMDPKQVRDIRDNCQFLFPGMSSTCDVHVYKTGECNKCTYYKDDEETKPDKQNNDVD